MRYMEAKGEEMKVRKNKILEKMRKGERAYGCGLSFPSAHIVELVGSVGLDFVSFDGEHGPFVPETIDELCRVADLGGLTPTARVTANDPQTINRFLDRGIMGVLAPHVNTAEEARAVVNACRFGPTGQRSWGGGRGTHWSTPTGDDKVRYMAETNENMLVMIQLETVESIENLSEILEVEGIDLYAYGPNDLATSMGYPGRPDHPEVVETMRKTTDRIHAAGKKLASDVMVSMNVNQVILEAARNLLKQ